MKNVGVKFGLEELSGEVLASKLGEIVPSRSHGFYSCHAKYIDPARADLRVPAIVPPHTERRIRNLAVGAFQALCCEGMARADFFLAGDEIFVNEVNTLPGFTSISMYPKLWEASGLPQSELMDKLIAHALARYARRRRLGDQ